MSSSRVQAGFAHGMQAEVRPSCAAAAANGTAAAHVATTGGPLQRCANRRSPRHSSAPAAASEPAVVLTGGVPAVTLPALSAVLLFVLKPEGAGVAVVVVAPAGLGLAAGAAGAAVAGAGVVVVAAAGLGVGVVAAAGAAGLGVGVAAAAGDAGMGVGVAAAVGAAGAAPAAPAAAPAAPAAGAVVVVVPASPFTLLPVPTPASISKMPAAMIASAQGSGQRQQAQHLAWPSGTQLCASSWHGG